MKKLSAILAFVLVLLTFTACGSAGYEKAIENYYKAIINEDAEKYMAVFANEEYIKYLIKQSEKDESIEDKDKLKDEDDVLDAYEEDVKNALKRYESDKDGGKGLGKGIKFDVEVKSVYEFNKDDVAALAKYLDDKGYEEDTVQDIVYVSYTCRLTGDEGSYRENRGNVVIKVGGKWYLTNELSSSDDIISGIVEGYDDEGLKAAFGGNNDYDYYY